MTFEELWNQIDAYNASRIKREFSQFANRLLSGLILHLVNQEEIEIGISYENREDFSMITYNRWESEKELSILLNRRGEYLLVFGFWDKDGKFQKSKYRLNSEEIANIPDGLKDLMSDALKNLKSVTFIRSALNK